MKIKIAELNIVIDSHKAENERITRANEELSHNIKETVTHYKEEVFHLEDQLRRKIEENDQRLKSSLDEAIKHHNTETVA